MMIVSPAELSSSEVERLRAFERQGHDALAKSYHAFFAPVTALARIMRDGEEMRDGCGKKRAIHVANRCSNALKCASALRHSRHEPRYAASLRPSICRAQETHN